MAVKKKSGATLTQVKPQREPISWEAGLRHLFTALILLTVVGTGVLWHEQTILPIKHVTVEGDLVHIDQHILSQTVKPYVSGGFLDVNVNRIQQAGESLPWVRQVQVRRVWPDTIHLIVEEQTVVARWNQTGLINSFGEVFYPQTMAKTKGLIEINGPKGLSEMMTRQLVKMQAELDALGLRVSKLTMDERHAWKLTLNEDIELNLGRSNMDIRFARFKTAFQGQLAQYQTNIAVVDMRYTNGFSVQWKQDQQPVLMESSNV
jgi:cell division protein FtsQ